MLYAKRRREGLDYLPTDYQLYFVLLWEYLGVIVMQGRGSEGGRGGEGGGDKGESKGLHLFKCSL